MDLNHGRITTKKLQNSGNVTLNGFVINSEQNQNSGQFSLANCSMNGVDFYSSGLFALDNVACTFKNVILDNNSTEKIKNSQINATQFVDNGNMQCEGSVNIVTDSYRHTGLLSQLPAEKDEKNQFCLTTKTMQLEGQASLDNLLIDIDHFTDSALLIGGRGLYHNYDVHDQLMLKTLDDFTMNDSILRNCSIGVEAASINFNANFADSQHNLALISTVGDVSLTGNIFANNVYVESAKNIYTNKTVYANDWISFKAAGTYYNMGGTLDGDTVAVKAASIENITPGSSNPYTSNNSKNWFVSSFFSRFLPAQTKKTNAAAPPISMGNTGVISGRHNTYLEASSGNISNYGGVIRAGQYAQLVAAGNVYNTCNVRMRQGKYDTIHEYDPGVIQGGYGREEDGVGLFVQANGKIIADASNFTSQGINYLSAHNGFTFTPEQHSYISEQKSSSTWYGKKETHTVTSNTIKGCTVSSSNAYNVLVSDAGGLDSVATCFASPQGTQISAKQTVKLYSLKSTTKESKNSSQLWGLTKHSHTEIHQEAIPTLFVDDGLTTILSSDGSVDARGAYFIGNGDLSIKAKKRIILGDTILDNSVTDESRNLGISAPGLDAWRAAHNSGKIWDAATATDSTLAKACHLANSKNAGETAANAVNLGLNLGNTVNSAMRGIEKDNIGGELMCRYGLGDAKGFNPTVTVSLTETKTKTNYQTLSNGGINRGGNVSLEAGEGVDLINGVVVHAGGNMDIDTPALIANAAALHSHSKQDSYTLSVGVSASGIQNVGAGYQGDSSQSTHYENAELSAGGNMHLHHGEGAIDLVELNGASITAKTLDAEIKKLVINDLQDTTSSQTVSVAANTNGQCSLHEGSSQSTKTVEHSGLYIEEGINVDGHRVHIDEAKMRGGQILTPGKNDIEIDKLIAEKQEDHQSSQGMGISFNINDLQRLSGQQSTNKTGEQLFAMVYVDDEKTNYKAIESTVIHGDAGTNAQIKHLVGEFHSSSDDGKKVIHDVEMNLELDVPITNQSYVENAKKNVQEGVKTIHQFFKPAPAPERVENPAVKPNNQKEKTVKLKKEIEEKIIELIQSNDGIKLTQDELENLYPDLNKEIETAIGSILKNASDDIFSSISKSLEEGAHDKPVFGAKCYVNSKGMLIDFVLNLGISSLTHNNDSLVQTAACATASDIVINIFLEQAAGSVAGPAGWILMGLSIAD